MDVFTIIGVICLIISIGILVFSIISLNKVNKLNKNLNNKINDIKPGDPGTQGLQGPIGPVGKDGKNGGIFIKSGPLRNIGQNMKENVNQFATRMSGLMPSSIAYMSDTQYFPENTWTLLSNGLLENGYGGCLTADKLNNIHMASCIESSNNNKWIYDTKGRLVYKKDKNMCLGLKNNTEITSGLILKNSIQKHQKLNNKKINEIIMEKCTPNNNLDQTQQWSFF